MEKHILFSIVFLCIVVRTQSATVTTNKCEGSQLVINCPKDHFIVIKGALYGRREASICSCGDPCKNTNCESLNSTTILVSRCEGKQSCIVESSNSIFGDPCVFTSKYLQVRYECVQNSLTQRAIITKNTCEGTQLAINCPNDHFIVIKEGFYGRRDTSICSCSVPCTNTNCTSFCNSESIVISTCEGKQSCIVESSNAVFGDPCPCTPKYLEATYACVASCPYGAYMSGDSCKECGLTSSSFRIINGENAASGAFPSVVRILYKDSFICSGTLISERTVLTAAHCLINDNNSNNYKIVYGVTNLNTEVSNKTSVVKVIWHKFFDEINILNDIGLLILKDAVTLGPNTGIACLPYFNGSFPIQYNISATLVGWGLINQTRETLPSVLQFAPQYIYDPSIFCNYDCTNSLSKPIQRNFFLQLCTGYQDSKGSCNGDSGGPVFITDNINGRMRQIVVGITSYKCGPCGALPSIVTNVKAYYDWIRRFME